MSCKYFLPLLLVTASSFGVPFDVYAPDDCEDDLIVVLTIPRQGLAPILAAAFIVFPGHSVHGVIDPAEQPILQLRRRLDFFHDPANSASFSTITDIPVRDSYNFVVDCNNLTLSLLPEAA